MIYSVLQDGHGTRYTAKVDGSGSLLITDRGIPPFEKSNRPIVPIRQFLKNSSNSSDMRVDGSTTSQEFFISADPDNDRYISALAFVIADANATLSQFGAITALTNGCRLFYENDDGENDIATALTTNFRFIQLAGGNPSFGDGLNSFRASNVVSTSEAFIPVLNMATTFGLLYGLQLDHGTNHRLVLEVNDNLTAIDEFTCIATGFDRKPDEV